MKDIKEKIEHVTAYLILICVPIFLFIFFNPISVENKAKRFYNEEFMGIIIEKSYSMRNTPMIKVENINGDKKTVYLYDSLFSILSISDSVYKPKQCDAILFFPSKIDWICDEYVWPSDKLILSDLGLLNCNCKTRFSKRPFIENFYN